MKREVKLVRLAKFEWPEKIVWLIFIACRAINLHHQNESDTADKDLEIISC